MNKMDDYHDQYQVTTPEYAYIKDVLGDDGEICYQKLFGKILIVDSLKYIMDNREDYYCSETKIGYGDDKIKKKITVKNSNFKICVNGSLSDGDRRWSEKSTTVLFPKIFACNLIKLSLQDQNISFNDYLVLVSSGTLVEISFITTQVIDKNNKTIPLEKLAEHLLNVQKIYMCYTTDEGTVESIRYACNYTDETSQALLDMPCFKKLKVFHLYCVPLEKTFKTFSKFMKKHAFADFDIRLRCFLPEQCVTDAENTQLEEIKKDLIETWPTNNKPQILI
uniref:Uncharacterized protein n=1 Tax=Panagrolaimus sp. PS1159 TaxID=55785 RepID=A0AC35G054_9BILA